jgi:hypothetical protein
MLRGDFHHHINSDPVDGWFIRHSAGELIDRAVAVGLDVLAITCHESVPYDEDATRYAAQRGLILLRGMEATVGGHHVLLLNFPEFPSGICTMSDIAAAKTSESLVIAPHPFYPGRVAGETTLKVHRHLFDAVEFSGLYTPLTRTFNRQAIAYARTVGLPVVGNSDTHFLWQMGKTSTLIDSVSEPAAVVEAIRQGRVRLQTEPLRWTHIARFIVASRATGWMVRASLDYMRRIVRRTRRPAPSSPLRDLELG